MGTELHGLDLDLYIAALSSKGRGREGRWLMPPRENWEGVGEERGGNREKWDKTREKRGEKWGKGDGLGPAIGHTRPPTAKFGLPASNLAA